MNHSRYSALFEPLALGPVTARNRFYQAPHCNGMGRNYPSSMAAMRGVKAEGGWAVVFSELADIHYSSDSPKNLRLWDEQDYPALQLMVEKVHQHHSLAGVQLSHLGFVSANLIGREIPISPSARTSYNISPVHTRSMSRHDIQQYRGWHKRAALDAQVIGYDMVLIYAAHDMGLPQHFLSPEHNQRSDEYGGCLENRVRLLRELIEDTMEAIGDSCAVGVRLGIDPGWLHAQSPLKNEYKEIFALIGELPHFWDVVVGKWSDDSATSRFQAEGHQESFVSFVKQSTSKPVVGVGRFTSPDTMLAQLNRGVLDMIGAARPSIADPFLPVKIEQGRIDEIRECIGCNICVSNHLLQSPLRCTQNPTMGEEWRRGWHPERMLAKNTHARVLIVGAGPAGLEAAVGLGKRGYDVLLAEAASQAGGRVSMESRLPGLASWARVRDYRLGQLEKLSNVTVYPGSTMTAADIKETNCEHVAIATGSRWKANGVGRFHATPIPIDTKQAVYTPDDIMAGTTIQGHVVIFEDDHFYMASVMAVKLVEHGCRVSMICPNATIAGFTEYTLERDKIYGQLLHLGVDITPHTALTEVVGGGVNVSCVFTGNVHSVDCDAVLMVAGREPENTILPEQIKPSNEANFTVTHIGDCRAPGTIAAAVYSGHRYAREFDLSLKPEPGFLRENVRISPQHASRGGFQ